MKKVKIILAAATALLLSASCDQVLDSLSKNPVFEFAGTSVYDGQTAFLGTTATCKIGWSTNDTKIVTLQYDENGKGCEATFALDEFPGNYKITDVEITATNLDDDTVDPFVGTITVLPWKLTVFQKVGSKWEQVSRENEDYFLWSERKDGGSNTFKVQMQSLKKDGTYQDISSVMYKMQISDKGKHDITWTGDVLPEGKVGTSKNCSIEFTMDAAPASTKEITAKLGAKTKSIRILNK